MDLTALPHDGMYLLDSNLVVHLQQDVNVHWTQWFQEHIQLGHCCFVTPTVRAEVKGALPDGVRLLAHSAEDTPTTEAITASFTGIFQSFCFSWVFVN
jgi:hypothetical protein